MCLWADWWNDYTENSTKYKLHCYFHNFEPFIGLHTMNSLWATSCRNVQVTFNVSHTVSVHIICVCMVRNTVSCCIYIYSMVSESRILFLWQNIGLTVSGNKSTFHNTCCLMRALQGDSGQRSLFPVRFMIF